MVKRYVDSVREMTRKTSGNKRKWIGRSKGGRKIEKVDKGDQIQIEQQTEESGTDLKSIQGGNRVV